MCSGSRWNPRKKCFFFFEGSKLVKIWKFFAPPAPLPFFEFLATPLVLLDWEVLCTYKYLGIHAFFWYIQQNIYTSWIFNCIVQTFFLLQRGNDLLKLSKWFEESELHDRLNDYDTLGWQINILFVLWLSLIQFDWNTSIVT